MTPRRLLVRALRPTVRVAVAASSSAVLAGALELERRLHEVGDARRDAYVRRWARSLLLALGVDILVDPPGFRPRDASAASGHLVVANHRSTVDIPLLIELFGGQFLARGDMAGWPVIGALARIGGTLWVDRADPGSGAGAVQRIRDRLRAKRTILVFPEGTTFAGDDVRPFYGGAFVAIARQRGEVHPVGIAYADDRAIYGDESIGDHFKRLLTLERTRVAVAVGAPISASGRSVHQLRDDAHAAVQALVFRARSLLVGTPG